jgi:hypothetical protein
MALTAGVRVEATSGTVAPATTVSMPPAPTFYDSDGNPYVTKKPNALAALAAAADTRGFTWEAASKGAFVFNIAGFMSLPDWSQGWTYDVNGVGYPVIDVAAVDFALKQGDQVLWAQDPDNTFARASYALVVDLSKTAYTSGEDLVVTVKADDLTKVNSQADYERFDLTDPSLLQTPSQFPPVENATVHVGSATYTTGADGTVTVPAPADGSYLVWAEKGMDTSAWYVRSPKTLVDFASALTMTGTTVSPTSFIPGKQSLKVSCTLSRAAGLHLQVRDAKGRLVWSRTVKQAGGSASCVWNGKAANGSFVPRHAAYTMSVKAVDTWGRSTTTTKIALKSR